ncbi:MAG: hypothetical protein ACLQVM_17115 [Terriglobia bacterium]
MTHSSYSKPASGTPFSYLATRREFLCLFALSSTHTSLELTIPEALKTPHKYNRLVVAASNKVGEFDAQFADAPFVFRHGQSFYMTYIGFDGEGYQTGLASSSDLVHWHKEGVILGRDPKSPVTRHNVVLTWILRQNDVFSPGRLKKVQGRYLGAYHAYPKPGLEEGPAVIGLCWSSDLFHWQLEAPCLRPEDGRPWEHAGLYKACIIEYLGAYYLFYNAKDRAGNWQEQTGFASSVDLKNWVRFSGNPVVRNGPPGSPDERFASDPCVLRCGDQWAIFYYSLDARGVARDLLALGRDFRQVAKCKGFLIDVGPAGSVDSTYAHKPSVVFNNGVLYHFYCAVSPEYGRGISVATSRLI